MDAQSELLKDALAHRPTKTLYHYTTQLGLLGIITSGEIWATHTQYLNDHREYRHATELLRRELERQYGLEKDPDRLAVLRDMVSDLSGIEGTNVCVCSFSEDRDSLSQWRAYGGSTSGYAIGFPSQFLEDIVRRERYYLAPCSYVPDYQEAIIHELVQMVAEENIAWRRNHPGPRFPRGGNLMAYLHRYAPILKDPAFAQEREWRIISHPLLCSAERFGYRSGPSMLIPYYRIPLVGTDFKMEIDEIVVGPTPHRDLARASVRNLLVRHGLNHEVVADSGVPYRNW